jgi:hypothetical protein
MSQVTQLVEVWLFIEGPFYEETRHHAPHNMLEVYLEFRSVYI